jgi:predicted oxidoreductase
MNTIQLGDSELQSSRLAYGCWRLAGTWEAAHVTPDRIAHGQAAVMAAYEAGYTLFDHADIYCSGVAESIFGQALSAVPGIRDQILIASKCGIRKAGDPEPHAPYRYDFSASYIIWSCEESLKRLRIDTLDLYQLHRPDFLLRPEEVASAFDQLKQSGKVREFGVSNFRPSQVSLLRKYCPMPILVNQIEISLCHLDALSDGTLDQCLENRITPVAWSPLAGGRLASTGGVDMKDPNHAHKARLQEALDSTAREYGVGRTTIALAWLLKHPGGIIPIVGTTNPERIREAVGAADIDLSRENWYRLTEAALGRHLP